MNVVIGLIVDQQERVLITQRPMTKPLGGLWEFPGGKVEPGEQNEQALSREIKEEVGLNILTSQFFDEIQGEPSEGEAPRLYVYLITAWVGEAQCCENQPALEWVHVTQLDHYLFPVANQVLVKKLKELAHAE